MCAIALPEFLFRPFIHFIAVFYRFKYSVVIWKSPQRIQPFVDVMIVGFGPLSTIKLNLMPS
jgi:hypothetical protein